MAVEITWKVAQQSDILKADEWLEGQAKGLVKVYRDHPYDSTKRILVGSYNSPNQTMGDKLTADTPRVGTSMAMTSNWYWCSTIAPMPRYSS